jgi:hypothetical protein
MMAQVSTPPERMMHRLDLAVASSPPVRLWMVERDDSKMDRNWSTFDLSMCVVEEFVMVAAVYLSRELLLDLFIHIIISFVSIFF